MELKNKDYYSGLLHIKRSKILGDDYSRLIKPSYQILAAIVVSVFPALLTPLAKRLNEDKLLFILSIVILVFSIIRAIQSIVLAKIDYNNLSYKKHDSIILFAVSALLTSGGLITILSCSFALFFFTYAVISLLAVLNFISLYKRIYQERSGFDYVCEMRIQLINTYVFIALTVLFFAIGLIKYNAVPYERIISVTLSIIICILLALNIYHSYALTYYPKIILSNALDALNPNSEAIIRIERAESNDTKRIAIDITNEFGYIFEDVFSEKRHKVLRNYIYILLTSSLGFGYWGHMRFYNVINDKGVKVGWIKIDTIHHCWIYTILEGLLLFIRFSYYLGLRNLYKVIRRAKSIADDQPQINNDTFVLSYIVIKEPYRQMQYGYATINLLKNAFFYSQTNNINVKKLSVLVRPDNIASIALFRKSRFREHYLVSEISSKGKIIFQYEKND